MERKSRQVGTDDADFPRIRYAVPHIESLESEHESGSSTGLNGPTEPLSEPLSSTSRAQRCCVTPVAPAPTLRIRLADALAYRGPPFRRGTAGTCGCPWRLELGRRDVAAGAVEAARVPEVDPGRSGQLESVKRALRPLASDELGLAETVDGLGQGVVIGIVAGADRGDGTRVGESLGVAGWPGTGPPDRGGGRARRGRPTGDSRSPSRGRRGRARRAGWPKPASRRSGG